MRDGRYILDHRHFKSCRLQSADGCFTTGAWALDEDFNRLQTMLHSGFCCRFRRCLGGEGEEMAFPAVSVQVTMVLLKEELI